MHLLYLRAIIDVRGKSNSSKNSLLVAVCPRDKIGLSGRFRTYYPQSVVRTLINYFIYSIASCPPFVCLSAYCLSCSLDVARYAFKNKTSNMLNKQTKSAQALTTDLGLLGASTYKFPLFSSPNRR